jgi:hypothetical protein
METSGNQQARPWERPEYASTESIGVEAQRISDRFRAVDQQPLRPNADELRDILRALHRPPPGTDSDRADYFAKALGIETVPCFIIDSKVSEDEFQTIARIVGIPKGSGGGLIRSIGASIVHPPTLEEDPEETIVHEHIHAKAGLIGNIWEEGFAELLQHAYRRLKHPDQFGRLPPPPYSIHGVGLIALSNICDQRPDIFESILAVKSSRGSAEAYQDFLERMHGLMGAERFRYLTDLPAISADGGTLWYERMPEALRGIIPDNNLDRPSEARAAALMKSVTSPTSFLDAFSDVAASMNATTPRAPVNNVLPIIKARLADYEARTGYRFNFPSLASILGITAPAEEGVVADPLATQINKITKGFTGSPDVGS